MSKFTVWLEHHTGATNTLANIVKMLLAVTPIEPHEKAGLMQAVQEVQDTSNGLHKGFTASAEEVAAAVAAGDMTERAAEVAATVQAADAAEVVKPIGPAPEPGLATKPAEDPAAVAAAQAKAERIAKLKAELAEAEAS